MFHTLYALLVLTYVARLVLTTSFVIIVMTCRLTLSRWAVHYHHVHHLQSRQESRIEFTYIYIISKVPTQLTASCCAVHDGW